MNGNENKIRQLTKTCTICGDKALGYNFNAITCESCKAFFRRNANKSKTSKCPFDGNCVIDVITRRFCQSCRLRKCFAVGMKKEWILSEEEKKMKRAKIEENRHRKTKSSDGGIEEEVDIVGENSSNLSTAPDSVESSWNYSPNNWVNSPPEASNAAASSSDLKFNCIQDSTYEKLAEAEFTYLPLRDHLLPSECSESESTLNSLEMAKLQELIDANEILKLPLSPSLAPESGDGSLMDIVNLTDHAIRRIIQMAKKLEGFRNLCQPDQVALLKGGCTEIMILRSVMSYNKEKDCWQDSKCKMLLKLEVLKQANVKIYEAHTNFINSFDFKWRNNENIMLLLSAITLFTPNRQNLKHREIVKFHQHMYMFLLKRYLETTIKSKCEAHTAYIKLMSKVEELHILNDDHVSIFLEVDPNIVGPLLIEIFDLKYH
ncbi:hypothetical protein B4U79_09088 [Dinothrombium tinctorium]|uniref:Nuclear hormone receptor HR96 n=1 Tax=Dinothrombium tinctorium TaxID=1965070 RepID=A0A3S3NV49_9ACAR|nr:hypothetical protein B4U79_09088 [Dinothrombium tinctorium]